MLPVVALVGRPNVGKSTLFNHLTKTKNALVYDMPGVTRDRQYGQGQVGPSPYIVIDTGGLAEPDHPQITEMTDPQVNQAMDEADVILFMVDAHDGVTSADEEIALFLRQTYADKVRVVINKSDRDDVTAVVAECYALGLGEAVAIAATIGRGIEKVMAEVLPQSDHSELTADDCAGIPIAIVGRPNVGKSTLINRILGEERVVVLDHPGTTRDSIPVPFERRGKTYTLIDTAGVRRRGKVSEAIEKFSIVKTLQAMQHANIVVVVIDARDGLTDQDLKLIGRVCDLGKGLVIAINKWDGMDEYDRDQVMQALDRQLSFVPFARRYHISALHGTGVGCLFNAIDEINDSVSQELPTAQVTRALEKAVQVHQPPLVKGRRMKCRYAHIGSRFPLVIVIHGKQLRAMPGSYRRYLSNYFRETFQLKGLPVVIECREDSNPYDA